MRLNLIAVLALLCNCAKGPIPDVRAHVVAHSEFATREWVAPGVKVDAVQQLLIASQGAVVSVQSRIRISDQGVTLVALDALGRRTLDVSWGPEGLNAQKAYWLPKSIRPNEVLADMMLIFWPREALHPLLTSQESTIADDGKLRRILVADLDPVIITYTSSRPKAWSETSILSDPNRNLKLTVQSSKNP